MTKKNFFAAAAVLAASAVTGLAAQANPIFIGYSLNGGAITQVGNSGNDGSASSNGVVSIGNGFAVQISGTGAPFLAQGTLFSNSTSISASAAGTVSVYVSETMNTLAAAAFTTGFGNNSQSTNGVTESSFATAGNVPFGTANPLSTATVAPGVATANQTVAAPPGLDSQYTITEVYTSTFGAGGGTVDATLSVRATPVAVPEPASMALFGTGLLGLGLIRRRRAK